ncbi:fimbrial protein [Burkholderia stagnalis]|uniref:fimbrial protein n=1 Tax=Burkholderia stagnalis TaxID=1503054 RepID=UPI000A69B6C5|nr:fimbrial protein [Burkholderia stagnalis]
MKRFIYASLLTVMLAMLVMPGRVWAQCWVKFPDGTEWNSVTSGEKKPIKFATPGFKVSFNPNIPDGTIFLRKDLDFHNVYGGGNITCNAGFGNVFYRPATLTWKSGFQKTSIPGLETAISFYPVNNLWGRVVQWGNGIDQITFTPTEDWARLRIHFRKTGPITSGGVISGRVGSMWVKEGYIDVVEWWLDGNIVIDPQVPTCRVSTPAITVPLGNVRASTFTGVGTPSPSKPFNIELECSGIEAEKTLDVYTTLTDHTNPGNVSDTLTLAKDSTATGVGIQVLNGNTVVKYGPDSSAIGNKNQWKAGAAGNGTFTIPLTARYVQTAPKVTPGTANGLATFTMSYK